MSNLGRRDLSGKTKHFPRLCIKENTQTICRLIFSFWLKKKKRSYQKKRKETSILPSFTLVFFKEPTLLCRVLNGSNLNWYKYPHTKQTEISSILSNMILVILLLNSKSKKRLRTLLWVVWTKQWDNQSVTNYFYLSIDQLIHQLLK